MLDPKESDFEAIEKWGLSQDPLKAITDFKEEYLNLRWNNEYHKKAWDAYVKRRSDWINYKNFDDYYKKAEKPIEKYKWEYLKNRKAWYICPLKWEKFAEKDVTRLLDLGCGDGDATQLLIDFIINDWKNKNYDGHELEIIGLDLNPSRIKNARQHVTSSHKKINFSFDVCDAIEKGIPYEDETFDYTITTGVLEILEDDPALKYAKEMCRVTEKGIYVEDLYDEFPGGYPRDNLNELYFEPNGFKVNERHVILTEPFLEQGTLDPQQLWPILKDQVLFASKKPV